MWVQSAPSQTLAQLAAASATVDIGGVVVKTADPAVVPKKRGQKWINTSTGKAWRSNGNAAVGDWVAIN